LVNQNFVVTAGSANASYTSETGRRMSMSVVTAGGFVRVRD
jgi:hypothetical protein